MSWILFLIPLIGFYPNLGYEGSKVLTFIILTSVALLWLGLKGQFFQQKIVFSDRFILPLLFLASLLVSSVNSSDPTLSLLGANPYYQGWVAYCALILFSFLIYNSKQLKRTYPYYLTLSAALVSLMALWQGLLLILHKNVFSYDGRVVSSFGQPNFYSGFLLLCLPLATEIVKNSKRRFWQICWIAILMGIFVAFSRATFILTLGYLFYLLLSQFPFYRRLAIILISLTVVISLGVSYKYQTGLWWREVMLPQTDAWLRVNAPEKRILIWIIGSQAIAKKPLLGYGLDQIPQALREVPMLSLSTKYQKSLKDLYINSSHNYYIDLLLFAGVIGFLLWSGVVVQFFLSHPSLVLKETMVLYLIWIFFQNQSIVHLMLFWLLTAL